MIVNDYSSQKKRTTDQQGFLNHVMHNAAFLSIMALFVPDRETLARQRQKMFVLVRTVTYAALFIGLLLIFLPARLLSWSGIVRPAAIEVQQVAGMVLGCPLTVRSFG